MNDNVAIALDRIKFYARDALVTVTQVGSRVAHVSRCCFGFLTSSHSVSASRGLDLLKSGTNPLQRCNAQDQWQVVQG